MSLFDTKGYIVTESGAAEDTTPEVEAYIMEAAMQDGLTDEELEEFLGDEDEVSGALKESVLLEKNIVRLDKKTKLSRAQKISVYSIAREKKDRDFKKLLTVWKMRRILNDKLFKKYGNAALVRAKKVMKQNQGAKSKMVKKAANNVSKQLNGDKIKNVKGARTN